MTFNQKFWIYYLLSISKTSIYSFWKTKPLLKRKNGNKRAILDLNSARKRTFETKGFVNEATFSNPTWTWSHPRAFDERGQFKLKLLISRPRRQVGPSANFSTCRHLILNGMKVSFKAQALKCTSFSFERENGSDRKGPLDFSIANSIPTFLVCIWIYAQFCQHVGIPTLSTVLRQLMLEEEIKEEKFWSSLQGIQTRHFLELKCCS